MLSTLRTLIALLVVCLMATSLGLCTDEKARWKSFTTYAAFDGEYTTDQFDVPCDWETINPLLVERDLEEYGLYLSFGESSVFGFQEHLNCVAFYTYPPTDNAQITMPNCACVSCGAQFCDSVEDRCSAGDRYFTEPMVEVSLLNNEDDDPPPEPHYYSGYRAVYNLDGELVLEEGSWFIDQDKDEFCRHWFDVMLALIGKAD